MTNGPGIGTSTRPIRHACWVFLFVSLESLPAVYLCLELYLFMNLLSVWWIGNPPRCIDNYTSHHPELTCWLNYWTMLNLVTIQTKQTRIISRSILQRMAVISWSWFRECSYFLHMLVRGGSSIFLTSPKGIPTYYLTNFPRKLYDESNLAWIGSRLSCSPLPHSPKSVNVRAASEKLENSLHSKIIN